MGSVQYSDPDGCDSENQGDRMRDMGVTAQGRVSLKRSDGEP